MFGLRQLKQKGFAGSQGIANFQPMFCHYVIMMAATIFTNAICLAVIMCRNRCGIYPVIRCSGDVMRTGCLNCPRAGCNSSGENSNNTYEKEYSLHDYECSIIMPLLSILLRGIS